MECNPTGKTLETGVGARRTGAAGAPPSPAWRTAPAPLAATLPGGGRGDPRQPTAGDGDQAGSRVAAEDELRCEKNGRFLL